jgi:hypothetical protein
MLSGSLAVVETLSYLGSLFVCGTLSHDGSLTRDGALSYVGSFVACGTLAPPRLTHSSWDFLFRLVRFPFLVLS